MVRYTFRIRLVCICLLVITRISSASDFDRNIHGIISEPYKGSKTNMNTYLANGKPLEDEESIVLESPIYNRTPKSPENPTDLSFEEILDSPTISSASASYNELSFMQRERESILPETKVAEFKTLLREVNNAYIRWRINNFILNTIKTKSTSWVKQIKEVTKSSEIQCNIKFKGENGDITNLLGLEEEDIKLSTNTSLALFSKSAFRNHAVEVVRANANKLKLQKKMFQDEFGGHSIKAMENMITRERMQQLELQRNIDDLVNQARQLLSRNHKTVQQLTTLRHNSDRHLQATTFALLRNKILYLRTVISLVKEKLDQIVLLDKNMITKMNTEGDNLKTQVTEMREDLKALQKSLSEYEKKEAASEKYRTIIAECEKLRKQLEHKTETLKMLNDPDMFF